MDPDRLIADNIDLPRIIASSITQGRVGRADYDELVGDGNEALVKAARRYVTTGTTIPFREWASKVVRSGMIDALRTRTHWRSRHRADVIPCDPADQVFVTLPAVHNELSLVDTDDAVVRLKADAGTTAMLCLLARGWMKLEVADAHGLSSGAISHRLAVMRRRGQDVRLRRMIEV